MKSICQALAAIHSILADLLLAFYSGVMFFVKICLVLEIGFVIFKVITNAKPYMVIGLVVLLAGVVFVLWTRATIRNSSTTDPVLINIGLFAIVRHPMYTGCILINMGLALIALHWSVTILACLQTIIFLIILFAEDIENEQLFGEPYRDYRKKVPITGVIIGIINYWIHKFKENYE